MPFLVPALVSGVSDALIVIVNRRRRTMHAQLLDQMAQLVVATTTTTTTEEEDDPDDPSFAAVHHVQYLALAAGLRLVLLVLPLMYHSYTGTAIRFYQCYRFFYGVTTVMVLLQMIALSMVDPGSLATLLPGGIPSGTPTTTPTTSTESTSNIHSNTTLNDMEDSDNNSSWLSKLTSAQIMESSEVSRYAWWILLLSLLSVTSHFIMLIHVRSTAPSLSYYYPLGSRKGRGKARLLYYYTSRNRGRSGTTGGSNRKNGQHRQNGENGDDVESQQQQQVPTTLRFPENNKSLAPTTPPPTVSGRLQRRQSQTNGHGHASDDEEAGDDSAIRSDFPPTSPIHKLSVHYDGTYTAAKFVFLCYGTVPTVLVFWHHAGYTCVIIA